MTARFKITEKIRAKMRQAKLRNPTRFWKGKKFSEEYRKKLSDAHKGNPGWHTGKHRPEISGSKHWNWKGGVSKTNKTQRQFLMHTLEYKLWRRAVFERDNYTCVFCGARNGNGKRVILNADHIKPWAKFPELRLAIDNGRTLCTDCHVKTETYGYRK